MKIIYKSKNDEVCKLFKYYEFKKFVEKYFSGNDDVVEKTNNDLKDEVLKCVTQGNIKYENLKIDNKLLNIILIKKLDNDENKLLRKRLRLGIFRVDDSAVYVISNIGTVKRLFEDENIERLDMILVKIMYLLKELTHDEKY